MQKLPLGLKNGRLVCVEEVAGDKACGCVCPACMRALVAKKGTQKLHHFAHLHTDACPFALESALHLYAKQLLESKRLIKLPELFCSITHKLLMRAQTVCFDEIRTEPRISGGLIPDLFVVHKGRSLLIEIAVTHYADVYKIEKLERQNLTALEIDAGKLVKELCWKGQRFDTGHFDNHLLYSRNYKKWLFHPRRKNYECRLFAKARTRKVKTWEATQYRSFWVNQCPVKLNQCGNHGANVLRDCINCPYCLEIKYAKSRRGGRTVMTKPEEVVCAGGLIV